MGSTESAGTLFPISVPALYRDPSRQKDLLFKDGGTNVFFLLPHPPFPMLFFLKKKAPCDFKSKWFSLTQKVEIGCDF